MGRKFPVFSDNISLIHHFLYFSFLIASFTATIAIITAICSVRFRRKSSSPPPPSPTVDPLNKSKDLNPSSSPPPITAETISNSENVSSIEKSENNITTETENNEEVQIKELPLPPAMLVPKEPSLLCNNNNNFKKVASERRASFSLSLKMPRSLSVARNWDHKGKVKIEDSVFFGKKTEESVWMKTIILGEKCVPDEEDDPVIYEGKGKKISAYHPKSYSTISRQNSFLDADVFQREDDRINNI